VPPANRVGAQIVVQREQSESRQVGKSIHQLSTADDLRPSVDLCLIEFTQSLLCFLSDRFNTALGNLADDTIVLNHNVVLLEVSAGDHTHRTDLNFVVGQHSKRAVHHFPQMHAGMLCGGFGFEEESELVLARFRFRVAVVTTDPNVGHFGVSLRHFGEGIEDGFGVGH